MKPDLQLNKFDPKPKTVVAVLAAHAQKLEDWKESALSVLSEWDEVWEAAGKPGILGASKAASVREYISKCRAQKPEAVCVGGHESLAGTFDIEAIEQSFFNHDHDGDEPSPGHWEKRRDEWRSFRAYLAAHPRQDTSPERTDEGCAPIVPDNSSCLPNTGIILSNRIKNYLMSGGIWNPELAIHDSVRDLLIECQEYIDGTPRVPFSDSDRLSWLIRENSRELIDPSWARDGEDPQLAVRERIDRHMIVSKYGGVTTKK
jgi:hypothetical protein